MTRRIIHHAPLASSFGDRFEATMTNRQVEIGFGSRRVHFTIQSSRFHRSARSAGDSPDSSVLWRAMGYVGCASLTLALVFVSGSMLRASPPITEYAVIMPIDAKVAPIATALRHRVKSSQLVRTRRATSPVSTANPVDDWSVEPESDLGIARPDPDVATLPTINGERAVAVYGPIRRVGGKSCRNVSVFVRGTDGNVSVSPTTQCEAVR